MKHKEKKIASICLVVVVVISVLTLSEFLKKSAIPTLKHKTYGETENANVVEPQDTTFTGLDSMVKTTTQGTYMVFPNLNLHKKQIINKPTYVRFSPFDEKKDKVITFSLDSASASLRYDLYSMQGALYDIGDYLPGKLSYKLDYLNEPYDKAKIYELCLAGKFRDWESSQAYLANNKEWINENMLKGKLTAIVYSSMPTNQIYQSDKSREKPIDKLSELRLKDFGKFYVLDKFDDSCAHGNKVLDVIKQVLSTYNLDSAFAKIITMPINYFKNVSKGDSLYRKFTVSHGYQDTVVADSAMLIANLGQDVNTPSNYLSVLYSLANDSLPDIISSSFYGMSEVPYLVGSFSDENISTNYFAAALNEDRDLDQFVNSVRVSGLKSSFAEPLYSYSNNYPRFGVIVVGNQMNKGVYRGMFSRSGRNVTVLGRGHLWGKKDCTKCIDSLQDVGTSFATPDVATKMFIAKAYWRMKGLDLNAIESRNRMVLASNLEPEFIGKFASAGSVDLRKMLEVSKGYLVGIDGEISTIDEVYGKPLLTYESGGRNFTYLSSEGIDKIRGVYRSGNETFFLKNIENCYWTKETDPSEINLTVKLRGLSEPVTITRKDLDSKYKQIVLLNSK